MEHSISVTRCCLPVTKLIFSEMCFSKDLNDGTNREVKPHHSERSVCAKTINSKNNNNKKTL